MAVPPTGTGRAAAAPVGPPRLSDSEGVCVVVPAYNEARSVGPLVRSLLTALPGVHVVVVDDGSIDATAAQAAQAGAAVISLAHNLGIGGAMQTGYLYASRAGYRIAVQVDGDGQHDPEEIPRLMDPILRGSADMTVGSRWLGRGSYRASATRRLGMRMLAGLVRLRCGSRFTDTTSGFRAVGQAAMELFAAEYPTDFPEVETLVRACRRGLRVEEVATSMHARSHGRSTIAGARAGYYMMRVIFLLLAGEPRSRESTA